MKESLKRLTQHVEENQHKPDDYINEKDGLLYCGKCHTPKQAYYEKPIFEGITTYPILCECMAKQREIEEENAKLKEQIKLIQKLRKKGIKDKKILEWTFANDNGSIANISKAKKYVENFEQMQVKNIGLLLWGDVGTGKSYFAACIANALIDKGISVSMTNFSVILNDLMKLNIDKNEYILSLNNNALLIIDDFGTQRNTPYALEQVYNIIERRYTACKPLIITTNLTLAEIENKDIQTDYRRLYDRIMEMCVPIQFKGESKRIEKAKMKLNMAKELLQ